MTTSAVGCAFGSRPKSTAPAFFTYPAVSFSPSVTTVIPWIGFQAMGLSSLPQSTTDFCRTAPPDEMPTDADYALIFINLPAAILTGALTRIGNAAKWDAFGQYCECSTATGPGCTNREGPIVFDIGSPAGSACGDKTWYLEGASPLLVFPAQQHLVRVQTDIVTTHDLQVDLYQQGFGAEDCRIWPAGTTLDRTYGARTDTARLGVAFRDAGSRPIWLEGNTIKLSYSNLTSEPPCTGAGTEPVLPVGGTPPSGLPPPPSCTTATVPDLCAGIDSLLQTSGLILRDLEITKNLIAPVGYFDGAEYANLTDSGNVPISRLLGLRVYVVTPPPDQPVLPGNPPYLWNCGWMAIANADGVLEERRVVRSGMTWLPRNAQLATSFQWALTPGTVVTAIELRPQQV